MLPAKKHAKMHLFPNVTPLYYHNRVITVLPAPWGLETPRGGGSVGQVLTGGGLECLQDGPCLWGRNAAGDVSPAASPLATRARDPKHRPSWPDGTRKCLGGHGAQPACPAAPGRSAGGVTAPLPSRLSPLPAAIPAPHTPCPTPRAHTPHPAPRAPHPTPHLYRGIKRVCLGLANTVTRHVLGSTWGSSVARPLPVVPTTSAMRRPSPSRLPAGSEGACPRLASGCLRPSDTAATIPVAITANAPAPRLFRGEERPAPSRGTAPTPPGGQG